tara:strand:+ start:664 stop:975 length:312 start_codon:yes stop_codon:yes gene_type:complete
MTDFNQNQEFPDSSYLSPQPTLVEKKIPDRPRAVRDENRNLNNNFIAPFPSMKYLDIMNTDDVDAKTRKSIENIKKFVNQIEDVDEKNEFISSLSIYLKAKRL